MLAMQLFAQSQAENSPLKMVELPKPQPAANQVLIRTLACGVCHTDLHIVEGDIHPPKLPIIPGHQVVGSIEALGTDVKKGKVGDLVGVPWLFEACQKCEYCLRGEENLCLNAHFTGFHVDGGYSEYMVANPQYLLPIPPVFDQVQAAPLLCAGIIGYRSLIKADVKPGERVGLVGFGASAHLAIQVARHWGCEIYAFSRSKEHQQHALDLGAAWAGNLGESMPKPLDRAVIFAPAGNLVPLVLEQLRPGGTLAINAVYMSPIPEMEYRLIYGERTLRSITNATYQDGVEFLNLAAKIKIKSSVTVYPFEEANQALDDLKHSRFNGEAVLVIQHEGVMV